MKSIFILATLIFTAGTISAQESWTIAVHKKILLTAKETSEEKNTKALKSSDWKKNGFLEVNYKGTQSKDWHHSIRFSDETGNELLVKDSVTYAKVSTSSLRKLFAGKKQIRISVTIAPTNPMIMMPARMVHLATLKLP